MLSPLKDYVFSKELTQLSQIQAAYLSSNKLCEHRGTDGSLVETRLKRFGRYEGEIGEIIYCQLEVDAKGINLHDKARDIITTWLIDDGIASRGHRKLLLSPTVKIIGISQVGEGGNLRIVIVLTDKFYSNKGGARLL